MRGSSSVPASPSPASPRFRFACSLLWFPPWCFVLLLVVQMSRKNLNEGKSQRLCFWQDFRTLVIRGTAKACSVLWRQQRRQDGVCVSGVCRVWWGLGGSRRAASPVPAGSVLVASDRDWWSAIRAGGLRPAAPLSSGHGDEVRLRQLAPAGLALTGAGGFSCPGPAPAPAGGSPTVLPRGLLHSVPMGRGSCCPSLGALHPQTSLRAPVFGAGGVCSDPVIPRPAARRAALEKPRS